MSLLRIAGLFCGLIALMIVFFRLRNQAEKRTDVWLTALFGISLILICLAPDILSLPAEILFQIHGQAEGSRISALLIISSGLLWFLFLALKIQSDEQKVQLDQYQRQVAVRTVLDSLRTPLQGNEILLLIPALNEADNLKVLLPNIPRMIHRHPVLALVINDGSQDSTSQIVRENSILLAEHLISKGGGSALKTGYAIARSLRVQFIATMDGDAQHDPRELPDLLRPVLEDRSDLVVGSRILGASPGSSRLRRLGVVFFSKLVSLLLGRKITDCSSGFRAFNQKILENCLFIQAQYHTAELLIEAVKRGFRVLELPVTIHKRLNGRSKKGVDWKYGLFFLRTVIRTWLR